MVLEALNDSKTILELIYAATKKEKTETISKSAKNGHICMFVCVNALVAKRYSSLTSLTRRPFSAVV